MYKSIRISTELHQKLRVYCAEHGMTMSEAIRRALEENKGITAVTVKSKSPPKIIEEKPISVLTDNTVSSIDQPHMCELPFCKNTAKGHYRVTTDAGENSKDLWMCAVHFNKAQKEGSVAEI